jgi:hypothetical protein
MSQLMFWLGLMATSVLAGGIDAPPVSAADAVVLASGPLQWCLGITPGGSSSLLTGTKTSGPRRF